MSRSALDVSQTKDFPAWYQAAVREADLAEESGVRGCMIIKPWGNGLWERMKAILNGAIEATGHENCYFPMLIPLKHFEQEAQHVDGFAKEMAVVTHHRLKVIDGKLQPDPEAKLEEPLIVRPTSETIIGSAMSRWVRSYRDLPLLLNQWANVMRWEMRPRMFLRTSEFLWQEGHTAHVDEADAMAETERMLGVYRDFAVHALALPVIDGHKPEHERFPGAVETLTIEAMMRDGKALQSGTSHYLGTNFAKAQNIQFQDDQGEWKHAHTTSWGLSTRMIGAVIMAHGDDDGLRLPPRVAPQQVILVPMLKGGEADEAIKTYCQELAEALRAQSVFGEALRVRVDLDADKAQNKRWRWVKKGAPLICEIGARDVENGKVAFLRRDALRTEDGKINSQVVEREDFPAMAAAALTEIHTALYDRASTFLAEHTHQVESFEDMVALFKSGEPAFAKLAWSRPTGEALETVIKRLKDHQLTVRVAPFDQGEVRGKCVFTGDQAVENIIVAKSY
ncbi:proline--tRNA ligase [Marinicauda pacifica]|uniref:Proline--tRNA ligase n=1 Tax=Marinicauda pacifica TaxID=1133559 RepID=A0A4S2HBN5_9PROT|nr:aminoacyl--tRNA ligase-related protein [Marinicauda pacifica]TGY93071.1 proline--tRNA ligase [Marinicauda pacifica]GGE42574.1 proline--tRNA ligase [Marinicauda pacifica]